MIEFIRVNDWTIAKLRVDSTDDEIEDFIGNTYWILESANRDPRADWFEYTFYNVNSGEYLFTGNCHGIGIRDYYPMSDFRIFYLGSSLNELFGV